MRETNLNMADFHILELSSKDQELLTTFWNNLLSFLETAAEFSNVNSSIESINLELGANGSIILGEIMKNKIRGIAVIDLLDITRGWLNHLIVLPEYRKQGIGNTLFLKSEEIFLQQHKKIVRVPINNASIANQTLLKRNQFYKLRETPSGFILFEKK